MRRIRVFPYIARRRSVAEWHKSLTGPAHNRTLQNQRLRQHQQEGVRPEERRRQHWLWAFRGIRQALSRSCNAEVEGQFGPGMACSLWIVYLNRLIIISAVVSTGRTD